MFSSPAKRKETPAAGLERPRCVVAVLICCAFALVLACIARESCARASDRDVGSSRAPVLVELFTSEGCSSCPPADNYVRSVDAAQPYRGAQVIVLSEHVDYWDQDGWKDPFSSHSFTDRQTDYVRALRLSTPYTPQIIIDGTTILKGSAQEIAQLFAKAAAEPKVAVRITSVTVGTPADVVRAHIDADGSAAKHAADVFFAVALDHAQSQVLKGENGGKLLSYVAVVEEMKKVGKLNKGKDFSQDVELKLKPAPDPKNLRVVAFVQESGPGEVLGAAMAKPGT
jgi:hypothetical protein